MNTFDKYLPFNYQQEKYYSVKIQKQMRLFQDQVFPKYDDEKSKAI